MNFEQFKLKYLKVPVVEYPNNREGKTPLVTVKVITYNHVWFVKECLDSILMQKTNFDFEILIAEDDSNDGTREICKQYADKYPDKVKLLLNSRKNNIPIYNKSSGTFNNTYANYNIHSKYIAFIEGDDYWVDEYSLQKRADFLEQNKDFVMCFHNAYRFYQEDRMLDNIKIVSYSQSQEIKNLDMIKINMPTLTIMHRNHLIETFDEKMLSVISGDVILRGKLSRFGKSMYLDNIKPAVYRIHSGGIYSCQPYSFRAKSSIGAREYLLSYFNSRGWESTHIKMNLIQYNYYFLKKIMIHEKKINVKFLWRITVLVFNKDVSRLFLLKKIRQIKKNKLIK